MKLAVVRHGQSEYNVLRLCNDDPAIPVRLTELGLTQAERAAAALVDDAAEAIYCSPLPRARQTAEIIAGVLVLNVNEGGRLSDIRSGFEGRPVADYLAAIESDPVHARVGGESLLDHAGRVNGFLDGLRQQRWQSVVLVVHEETMRVIKARCEGLSLSSVVGQPFENAVPYRVDLR